MKKYEIESFLKSFFISFLLLEALMAVVMWQNFGRVKQGIGAQIKSQMEVCRYDAKCKGFEVDFVKKAKGLETKKLYTGQNVYAYFDIPTVENFLMKVSLDRAAYYAQIEQARSEFVGDFMLYSVVILLLSFLFSLYALWPLRKALRVNEEFARDILHDFNTPISSMMINFRLFRDEIGANKKLDRLENNIETIIALQHNLRAFLVDMETQKETFDLRDVLRKRVEYFQALYTECTYDLEMPSVRVECNKDALIRILDNLLSNAGKYNRVNGEVHIRYGVNRIKIIDTGKGIAEPKKIFERFYKEQDRGTGIGMHIVRKLADEMGAGIAVESVLNQGTTVTVDLSNIVVADKGTE